VSPRVFLALLVVTVFAIWVGDIVAQEYAAPGMERTFAVLVIAVAIVAPVAWILERLGYIRKEKVELGRRREAPAPKRQGDGGAA
jgi:uncharacterized membrane protein YfcA